MIPWGLYGQQRRELHLAEVVHYLTSLVPNSLLFFIIP